jgi:hypothetical protein
VRTRSTSAHSTASARTPPGSAAVHAASARSRLTGRGRSRRRDEQPREQFGHLEDRAVLDRPDRGPVLVEPIDQPERGRARRAQRRDHASHAALVDPAGVVALLGHRPRVAERDHRQPALQRLAQAARAGLADEEIGQPHVARHLAGEADRRMRRGAAHRPQRIEQRVVVAAQEHQLHVVEDAGDRRHLRRAVAAEHHDAGRAARIEPERASSGVAIGRHRLVELAPQQHAADPHDPLVAIAGRARLLDRTIGAAHQVLIEAGLDPEVRRHVGEVGHHGDVRHARPGRRHRLVQRAAEVRHQRHDQVRLGARPVRGQPARERRVADPDRRLQQPQLGAEAQRPAAREPPVVQVLGRHARHATERVVGVEDAHQVDEPHVPRPPLRGEHAFQRQRRGAVPAAGVEVDEIDVDHGADGCCAPDLTRP